MLNPIKTINNISLDTLCKLARKAIKNAPNSDWKGRGCINPTTSQSLPVKNYKGDLLATANVGFFKFETPKEDTFGDNHFIGFTLAAITVDRKTYYETHPVIRELDEADLNNAASNFSRRFCPDCRAIDSITQSHRRAGPECIIVTYKCTKCSYMDRDAID